MVACGCAVCTSVNSKDKRLRSSALIETDNETILIDAGPDFRYQMLRKQVKNLDAILITHAHRDHIAGLDDVRSFNFIYRKPMDVYASKNHQLEIKREFSYAFAANGYPGLPQYNLKNIDDHAFTIKKTVIQPLSVLHHKMEVYGFRINNFAYITDTNYIPGSTLALLEGVDYMVISAVRKEPHPSHYNLEQAINVLQFINPKIGYITHLSHLMGLHDDVEKILPKNIHLAYDGLEILL